MSQTQKYRTDLAEIPLPEVLAKVRKLKVPGILKATRGGVVKQVFVRGGRIVHAVSEDRDDSLGEYLVRSSRLSGENLERLTRRRLASQQRFGELLVESDVLAPADVLQALKDHLEDIVSSLFAWPDGEVEFTVGKLKSSVPTQIQLPLDRVIFEGIARLPDPKGLVLRLGERDTVLEPCFRTEELIRLGLEGNEVQLLRQVNAQSSLYELLQHKPGSPGENAKLLYAFWVLGLVRRRKRTRPSTGPLKVKLKATGDSFSG